MPIYEFQCQKCGERFEIVSRHDQRDEKAACPACGGRALTQVFGRFTVGIARTRLNPGTFVRREGAKPAYERPAQE